MLGEERDKRQRQENKDRQKGAPSESQAKLNLNNASGEEASNAVERLGCETAETIIYYRVTIEKTMAKLKTGKS